jgi:hypothetical protein
MAALQAHAEKRHLITYIPQSNGNASFTVRAPPPEKCVSVMVNGSDYLLQMIAKARQLIKCEALTPEEVEGSSNARTR